MCRPAFAGSRGFQRGPTRRFDRRRDERPRGSEGPRARPASPATHAGRPVRRRPGTGDAHSAMVRPGSAGLGSSPSCIRAPEPVARNDPWRAVVEEPACRGSRSSGSGRFVGARWSSTGRREDAANRVRRRHGRTIRWPRRPPSCEPISVCAQANATSVGAGPGHERRAPGGSGSRGRAHPWLGSSTSNAPARYTHDPRARLVRALSASRARPAPTSRRRPRRGTPRFRRPSPRPVRSPRA